jgi:hypothetical protein
MMRSQNFKFAAAFLALLVVPIAMAGPPLTCFPFDIGDAKSLPWTAERGLGSPRNDYDIRQLAGDTIALLGERTPVIVRMETLRRAALYASKAEKSGQELLDRLRVGATAGTGGQSALALFDYGYMIETMKQARGSSFDAAALASPPNGYAYIREALERRPNDPEMEFAAAVVTLWPKQAQHETHLRRAVAGAANDPLLVSNLLSHFPSLEGTLANLRRSADGSARKR